MTHINEIDTLIEARWVIPVDAQQSVLDNHAVAVHQGNIADILPSHTAHTKFNPKNTINLNNHALIPGLVNAHTHAAMILIHELTDDLP